MVTYPAPVIDPATLERAATLADAAFERVLELTGDTEFETYLVGCRYGSKDGWGEPDTDAEALRIEARRALRVRLEAAWPGRRVVSAGADVDITMRPGRPEFVTAKSAPLLIAGRYCKLVRGMSQTVFNCRNCRGRRAERTVGRNDPCDVCEGSRRLYAESVEDFVGPPIARAARAAGATFHGAGREDVDVRMLGAGRPFIVRVASPLRRGLDLSGVAREVAETSGGRVTVSELRVVDRAAMRRVTSEHGEKTYRAVVEAAGVGTFPEDAAARIASLAGTTIRQRTPERVEARRPDLVRLRRLLGVVVEEAGERTLTVTLRTDPGTYVKELVSGDAGRTKPSFSEALSQECECVVLDVLATGG